MSDQTAEDEDRARRLEWFNEARFGMFVHWGLYALSGAEGWPAPHRSLSQRSREEEYERLAGLFRPKPFPAREWARLAREAGMKYMVMTTKHHEGFCLFDSPLTDCTSAKAAAGRDLVAEYVDACRSEGLRVGFYYSLMDWHHPDWHQCATDEAARQRLVSFIHGQVRELCTNYGKIDVMWYDGAAPLDEEGWESAKMNAMVRELQPDILINNRSWSKEDFNTPEKRIWAYAESDRAWEACFTTNNNWGYRASGDDWKTPVQIVRMLGQVANGGANLLLNVGPEADGSVPEPCVGLLKRVGEWMRANGEAVYNSERIQRPEWMQLGIFTFRARTLYLHLYLWPGQQGQQIEMRGLETEVLSARFLVSGEPIDFEQTGDHLVLQGMPETAPDELATVIAMELREAPRRRLDSRGVLLRGVHLAEARLKGFIDSRGEAGYFGE